MYAEVVVAKKDAALSRIELLQGTLDLIILQTLRWGPRHGYGIAQMIRAGSLWVAPGLTQASNVIWPETFKPGGLFRLAHCFRPSRDNAAFDASKPA